jgi:hypothetical protein
MFNKIIFSVLAVLVCILLVSSLSANEERPSLSRVQVLALLAAGVFPENLVLDIESRGTAFALDDNFSALATAAGADAVVMAALRKAKNNPPASSESRRTKQP